MNETPKPVQPTAKKTSFAADVMQMQKHLAALYAIAKKWQRVLEQRKTQA